MKHWDEYHDEGFIFVRTQKYPGHPEVAKTVERRIKRILKISNLNKELTPHSLRHTHTSLLAEAGVPLEEIMDRLGHTDDDTTKKVYLHVTNSEKKKLLKNSAN